MIKEIFAGLGILAIGLLFLIILFPLSFLFGIIWGLMLYPFLGQAALGVGFFLGFLSALGYLKDVHYR